MKDWEEVFDRNFVEEYKLRDGGWAFRIIGHPLTVKNFIRSLLQQQQDFFKQTGKQGGESRKKQNPDYSAIGKKGAEKRWKKNKKG
jgi:hypothetical protein